jgi:hypothetical protein
MHMVRQIFEVFDVQNWRASRQRLLRQLYEDTSEWILWSNGIGDWRIQDQTLLARQIGEAAATDGLALHAAPRRRLRSGKGQAAAIEVPVLWRRVELIEYLQRLRGWMVPSGLYFTYDLWEHMRRSGKTKTLADSCGIRQTRSLPLPLGETEVDYIREVLERPVPTTPPQSAPTVSILLAVYNEKTRVSWAIRSVMAQTYDRWELIVVDDGSTDGSADYIAKHLHDNRIHILRMPRKAGKASALNTGLKRAQGAYILELDADDWLVPSAIHQLVRAMENCDPQAAVVSGPHGVWTESVQGHLLFQKIWPYTPFLLTETFARTVVPRFYRTQFLRQVGGWPELPPPYGSMFEDLAVMDRLTKRHPVCEVDNCLYHRVLRGRSISQTHRANYADWMRTWRASSHRL